ncbi:PKD domain-containing protein [Cohnella abietis]|uniref:PKD/Chitinase domain-containing protein n=1 Tax=Cohnella abietis TaxID=2507935 RepID=A0A3T1DAB2_9BACL|nr:PKD domain-containing protein [Cohnella abietis]BBI35013.1 hypothetical protein KCTCHS21_44120 [Cohnella abietis]
MKKILRVILILFIGVTVIPFSTSLAFPDNENEFNEYLISQGQELVSSNNNRPVNFQIYKKYNLIVYGSSGPFGDSKPNSICSSIPGTQFRYLGYTVKDQPYTNPCYPQDLIGDKPEDWNTYLKQPDGPNSWRAISPSQESFLRKAILTGNNASSPNYTANYIGQKMGGINLYDQYTKVQSPPLWKTGGSVYTQHYGSNNKVWYATFTSPPMVGETIVSGSIATPNGETYTIGKDQDSVDILYNVTANANLSGVAIKEDVSILKASSGSNNASQGGTASVTLSNQKVTIKRSSYPESSADIKVPVPLKGQAYIKNSFKEEQTVDVGKTVNVIIQPLGDEPYVTATAATNPNSIKFNNTDVVVTVTVSGALKNYTNTANVKEWRLYAKHKDDVGNATLQTKTIPGADLTATTNFKFSIPKSKIAGDSFTQNYVVTATAIFNKAVYGKAQLSGSAEASSYVYKETLPPATEGNIPPVAVINGTGYTSAGQSFTLNGSGSYDPDGTIVAYQWGSDDCQLLSSSFNVQAQFICMNPGTYKFNLIVTDNKGATGDAWHTVIAAPPKPSALIRVNGVLKENRKVTLDASGSYSPEAYPINNAMTTWQIIPISGGTMADIKYHDSLIGAKSKDVLFKKAGEYLVRLTVTNTVGESDTKERTIIIKPDEAPHAEITGISPIYRQSYSDNKAYVDLKDHSYSPDADIIASRTWERAYDSNNNGLFTDETWTTLESIGNGKFFYEYVNDVGKYAYRVRVTETYSEPTMPEFLTPADARSSVSPLLVVEVDNYAPTVSFGLQKKKKVDLVFNMGDTISGDMAALKTKVNTLVLPELALNGIEANVKYIDSKPKVTDAFAYVLHSGESPSIDQLYYYSPSTNTNTLVATMTGYGYASPQPIIRTDGKMYYMINGYDFKLYDPATGSSTTIFTAPKRSHIYTVSPEGNIYFGYAYSVDAYSPTFHYLKMYNQATNKIVDFDSTFMSLMYILYDFNGRVLMNTGFDTYGNYYCGAYKNDLSGGNSMHCGASPSIATPFGQAFSYGGGLMRALQSYSYSGYSTLWSLPGTVDSAAASYTEPNLYFNGDVHPWGRQLPAELGFFKYNYSKGILEQIDVNQVIVHAVSYDNKVYYSYKNATYKIYVYDPATNSKELLFNATGAVNGPPVRYQSVLPVPVSPPLSEALTRSATTWTENAQRYFVDISDLYHSDLDKPGLKAEVLKELISNDVSYIQFGSSANSAQASSLVAQNNGKGKFYNNTSLDSSLMAFRDHIIPAANLDSPVIQYIALGEEIEYTTSYDDVEGDPLLRSRWLFDHDSSVFENNQGTISSNGAYVTSPIVKPDKVGRYDVLYQAQDNPKNDSRFSSYRKWSDGPGGRMTFYVHRIPFALFTASATLVGGNYSVSISEFSYDLDHQSEAGGGIVEKVWRWKTATAANWTNGPLPSTIAANQTYLISLKVKDKEGAWSEENIQVVGDTGNLPPIALFTVDPARISLSQSYKITDKSYDPNGDPIAEWQWSATKDSLEIYAGATAPTASQLKSGASAKGKPQVGTYSITLRVRDAPPSGLSLWSQPYSQNVVIANSQPVATMIFPSGSEAQPTVVATKRPILKWSQTDADPGTLFTRYQLQITNEANDTFIVDSGTMNQNTTLNSATWAVNSDLPTGKKLRVRVRVSDEYEWSNWSPQTWLIVNSPPIADFDWSPKPAWEGDTITFKNKSIDPDNDILTSEWVVTGPGGYTRKSTLTDFSLTDTLNRPGIYFVTLTVKDPHQASDSITKQVVVGELTLFAKVNHTPEWEEHRLNWNAKHPSKLRDKNVFWAGEAFVLEATVTDTGNSTTKALSVKAIATTKLQKSLTEASPGSLLWNGILREADTGIIFKDLPEGSYSYIFTVNYSNGATKTFTVIIQIKDTVDHYIQVHRIQ